MATTTPDGIYYPISTTQIAPLETQFSTLATSVQTAMTNKKQITVATAAALGALTLATYPNYLAYVSGNGSLWYNTGTKWQLANIPVVASSAARDALYSGLATVTQGDQVFRNDLGYEETYYALYNVSTNPGGRTVAGWYNNQRNIGLVPIIPTSVQVASGSGSYSTTTGLVSFSAATSVSVNGCFTSEYRNYRIIFNGLTATAYADGNMRLRASGTDLTTNYYRSGVLLETTAVTGFSNANDTNWGNALTITGFASYAQSAIEIKEPANTLPKTVQYMNNGWSGTYMRYINAAGFNTSALAYDGFTIYASTGNFSGTFKIYGYN